jgi:hypothetical protein
MTQICYITNAASGRAIQLARAESATVVLFYAPIRSIVVWLASKYISLYCWWCLIRPYNPTRFLRLLKADVVAIVLLVIAAAYIALFSMGAGRTPAPL